MDYGISAAVFRQRFPADIVYREPVCKLRIELEFFHIGAEDQGAVGGETFHAEGNQC